MCSSCLGGIRPSPLTRNASRLRKNYTGAARRLDSEMAESRVEDPRSVGSGSSIALGSGALGSADDSACSPTYGGM